MEKLRLDNYSNLNIEELNINNKENSNQTESIEKDANDQNPDEITLDEYVKKAEVDHITLLKVIIFLLFLGASIFVFYHLFFGANGFIAQKDKAHELKEIKELKTLKEDKLNEKKEFLEGIKAGDKELLEKLAREKGYMYPDEKIIKIPEVEDNSVINNPKRETVKINGEKNLEITYLVISVSITILIIILSFFINKVKFKSK